MKTFVHILFLVLLLPLSSRAEFFGGVSPEMQGHQFRFYAGFIAGIDGSIKETFRPYYHATGQDYKQSLAESYNLDDFGVSAPYKLFGFSYERQWSYWAFRSNTLLLSLSTDTTAKRDYYLGIGDHIKYNGRKYDHLKIPKGTDFSVDFKGLLSDFTLGFTPVTFLYNDDFVKFTPSLDLGLVLALGQYDIDAGHATGTAVYQNPPVDFVVGGSSSSYIGAGAPMIGLSGEIRADLVNDSQWISRFGISYFAYSGDSSLFTSEEHRSKHLDISFFTFTAETGLRFPFEGGDALSLGARLQWMAIDAEVESKEKSQEATANAHERFNKTADFDLYTFLFYIGYSF